MILIDGKYVRMKTEQFAKFKYKVVMEKSRVHHIVQYFLSCLPILSISKYYPQCIMIMELRKGYFLT